MYTVHCTVSRSQSSFLIRFVHGPILVKIKLQYKLSSFICGTSHREMVSTIFKVFGMTRPWVVEPKTSQTLRKSRL